MLKYSKQLCEPLPLHIFINYRSVYMLIKRMRTEIQAYAPSLKFPRYPNKGKYKRVIELFVG